MLVNCTEPKVPVLPFPTDWSVHEQDGQNTPICVTSKSLWFWGYSVNDIERSEFPLPLNLLPQQPSKARRFSALHINMKHKNPKLFFHRPFHDLYY